MTKTDRRVHAVSLLLVALAALTLATIGWGETRWWAFPAMVAAVGLSEHWAVKLRIGRQHWTFALTEAAMAGAYVFAPGGWCIVATALGVGLALYGSGKRGLKVEFNVAQFGAAAGAGALVAASGGGGLVAASLGLGAFWLVNYLSVAVILRVTLAANRFRDIFDVSGALGAVNAAGNASLGLLAAWLSVNAPLGLLALIVPCGLLWVSYDQQTRQAFETRLFTELADGEERVSGRSSDASARVLLTAAARLYGGDGEMVLMTSDGPVRYVGDERSVLRQRVEQDVFNEPWVLRALGARAITAGVESDRPYCSAVLGDVQAPTAVLVIRRPVGGNAFDRREQTLAGVLIRQAASWMSVAELTESRDEALELAEAAGEAARALGNMGADTWPAMVSLRESAARLGRLATMPEGPDPVGDIVGELHSAERAVASLLGAIALAAEPELAALDTHELVRLDAQGAGDDSVWTTTGVLEVEAADAAP